MKKNITLLNLILLAILVSFSSCKKFLEETSPDITIPTTVKHFEELLYGEGYPKPQTAILEMLSDNTKFNYAAADTRPFEGIAMISLYLWQKDAELRQPNVVTPIWTNTYKAISVCNLVIDGLTKMRPGAERDHVLGQALILRAHHYFLLVNVYGEPYRRGQNKALGVPIKTTALAEDIKYKRNSVNEVYEFIESDLEAGINLINKDKSTSLNGEINYLSALTLTSRVALFMEDYDKVIETGNKYLQHSVPLLSHADNLQGRKFISTQNKEITMLFGGSYTELSTPYVNTQLNSRSSLVVADDILALFNKDLKAGQVDARVNWFFETGSTGQKYPKKTDLSKRNAYRAPEIYLNLAEAYFHKGDKETALNLINDLRRARITNYVPFTVGDAAVLDLEKFIEEERRREFCFEDFRWFDLRRYNREVHHDYETAMGKFRVTLKPDDLGNTMQIPLIEQNRNPLIELVPQPERVPVKL